ncbi:MAG: flagellar export protein FliJ [Sulfurimonas sp.]|uniref:flagellar export protein FliJ n=1 Tax=Sulfurimonas sp. TaxID=2022749 RepID=UPI0026382EB4|nr:flagellar export protein FliJ [Sulfurimonas sp.]MDD5372915.1 flagellar export protein FliJ [Sulfurimonas sp.]
MKTRFSSLVKLKKNTMQKSEEILQKANIDLNSASTALESSYLSLKELESPSSGTVGEMLASRVLFHSQMDTINHNKEWVGFAANQVAQAKKQLKLDMMEHEKFQYLEFEEIKEELKKRKLKEAKDLDEIALMTYTRKNR